MEKKAQDLVILDVRPLSSFTDFFLICSGQSHRQVQALSRHIEDTLRREGLKPLGVEGQEEGNWVLLDFNDVIIHIFYQPWREFYDLEGLWSEAARLALEPSPAASAEAPPPVEANP